MATPKLQSRFFKPILPPGQFRPILLEHFHIMGETSEERWLRISSYKIIEREGETPIIPGPRLTGAAPETPEEQKLDSETEEEVK